MTMLYATAWFHSQEPMDAGIIWAPVVAALGASLLTAIATFGLYWWQRRRDDQAGAMASRLAAYGKLHARASSFVRRVDVLGLANRFRSGISEGLAVSLGHRQPLDVFALHEWVDVDFRAVSDAWSEICTIGSQDAIDAAGTLMEACGELMKYATATDIGRSYLKRLIMGEQVTPEQAEAWQVSRRHVFKQLEVFANLVRREGGHVPASLPIHRAAQEQATSA